MRRTLGAVALAVTLGACAHGTAQVAINAPPAPANPPAACAAGGTQMARIELIFGLDVKGGGRITETDWARFLKDEVTPRFPDGLTAVDGFGQWRVPKDGRIVQLETKLLLIWYAPSAQAEASIEAIRAAYKKRFNQISVMRIDGMDCVSF